MKNTLAFLAAMVLIIIIGYSANSRSAKFTDYIAESPTSGIFEFTDGDLVYKCKVNEGTNSGDTLYCTKINFHDDPYGKSPTQVTCLATLKRFRSGVVHPDIAGCT